MLSAFSGDMTREQLQEILGLADDDHFRTAYLRPALDAGLIEMTIPDKPRSSKQRYRITGDGRRYIAKSQLDAEPAADARPSTGPTPEVTPDVAPEVTPDVRLLSAFSGDMTREQLQEILGLADDDHFRTAYLRPALDAGLIEMTIPDKPRSSKQRYRMTAAGKGLAPVSAGSQSQR